MTVVARVRILLATALGVLALGVWPAAAASATGIEGVPAFGHVFVIIGENTELSALTMNNAPYLLGTIKPNSAWLTVTGGSPRRMASEIAS